MKQLIHQKLELAHWISENAGDLVKAGIAGTIGWIIKGFGWLFSQNIPLGKILTFQVYGVSVSNALSIAATILAIAYMVWRWRRDKVKFDQWKDDHKED